MSSAGSLHAVRATTEEFGRHATTLLAQKLLIGLALTLWVCIPYFGLQHAAAFRVTLMPVWGLDQIVPFYPDAAWLYLSLYLLLPIAPLLMTTRRELACYAASVAIVSMVSNLIFFLCPTGLTRPAVDAPGLAYALILATDRPVNACPSLHASLAVLSALWCARLLRATDNRRAWFWQVLAWAWTLAILYATLLTKQHVLVDLLAGGALAVVVYAGVIRVGMRQAAPAVFADSLGRVSVTAGAALEARTLVSAGIEPQIDGLRRLDLRKRLAELAFFVALWVGSASLTLIAGLADDGPSAWASYAVGVFLSAVAINSFVLLLHDGMHHTLFATPNWNRTVSRFLGTTVLMSFTAYQVMHLRHHTYLGDPRDPDEYRNRTNNRYLLWTMHFLRLFLGSFLYLLFIPALAWKHGSARDRHCIIEEYLFIASVAGACALTVPGTVLLHGWLVPALLVGFMVNARGFTQHGMTDVADPFLASRSIRANPVVAFCLLYENYHLEHHLFPEVPSYHLPALHRLIWPRLPRAVTGRSYVAFLLHFLRATLTLDETPIGLRVQQKSVLRSPGGRPLSPGAAPAGGSPFMAE
jgi:fatty acid desaturase